MGIKNQATVYPFAEMFEVESESTTIVPIWNIPANTLIEKVFCRVKRAAIRAADGVNLTIGDVAAANGFILAADAKGAVGTIYGKSIVEIGAHLAELVESGATDHNQIIPSGKFYAAAGEVLRLVLSAVILTTDTNCIVQVFVIGKSFAL